MNAPARNVEDEIRDALRQRADEAPIVSTPALARSSMRRPVHKRPVARLVAAGVAASSIAATVAVIVSVTNGDEEGRRVVASSPDGNADAVAGTPSPSDPQVPRLTFDTPGFAYQRVQECEGSGPTPPPSPAPTSTVQTFGRSYSESPLLFLRTVEAAEVRGGFGLVDARFGDPFAVRGVTGYASRSRGRDRGWNLSVRLPDDRAIYAIVIGLDLAEVTPVLEGLSPRADGRWDAPLLPPGMVELPPSQVQGGCGYSASGRLSDDAPGGFEVNLYNDAFDWRLADRASSTVGPIQAVTVGGVPGALGSYRDNDHWVMFEPEPGRTMEIRASSMSRDDVLELVGHARFVDEATWRAARTGG